MSYKWNVWSLNFLTFTKSLNKVERKLVFKNKKKQNKKKEMSIFSLGTSLWFFTFFYFTNMVESLGSFWSLRMTFSSGIVIFPSFTCSPSSPSYLLLFFFFDIYIYMMRNSVVLNDLFQKTEQRKGKRKQEQGLAICTFSVLKRSKFVLTTQLTVW